jgi:hypothetical protein
MDAAAYLALSAALDRELPCAIEGLAEARERAAMAFEDLAAHAITGRVVSNVEQLPSGARHRWNLWRRINSLHENLRATVALCCETAYVALGTMTGGPIERLVLCISAMMNDVARPSVNYDYYDIERGLVRGGVESDGEGEDGEGEDAGEEIGGVDGMYMEG